MNSWLEIGPGSWKHEWRHSASFLPARGSVGEAGHVAHSRRSDTRIASRFCAPLCQPVGNGARG